MPEHYLASDLQVWGIIIAQAQAQAAGAIFIKHSVLQSVI